MCGDADVIHVRILYTYVQSIAIVRRMIALVPSIRLDETTFASLRCGTPTANQWHSLHSSAPSPSTRPPPLPSAQRVKLRSRPFLTSRFSNVFSETSRRLGSEKRNGVRRRAAEAGVPRERNSAARLTMVQGRFAHHRYL